MEPSAADSQVTLALDREKFAGSLQHLVNNGAGGGVTDMSLRCRVFAVAAPSETLAVTGIHPSSNPKYSYFRFGNPTGRDGWYEVTLRNDRGRTLGTARGTVAARTTLHIEIGALERSAGISTAGEAGKFLSADARLGFDGTVQHLVWDGVALANVSPAGTRFESASRRVSYVHTSRLGAYPSSLVIGNSGTAAATARLAVYDSATGAKIATWTSPSISAGGRK